MIKKYMIGVVMVAALLVVLGFLLLHGTNLAVLNPQGIIADKQRNLLVFTFFLSMVVIVPVFLLLFFISWKYRESNKKATYRPEWDGSRVLETIWWGIPITIIAILAVVTWRTSHELDPFRPLSSAMQPLTVQVVALQWKWLFIYPEQKVASVNYVRFPSDTPVRFIITSDAPMNSFWIPSLGGQVYAMSGMSTELNLSAKSNGSYSGLSANISGTGFSKMRFTAESMSTADFAKWVGQTRSAGSELNAVSYAALARPSVPAAPTDYTLSDSSLYDKIVKKYAPTMPAMKGM